MAEEYQEMLQQWVEERTGLMRDGRNETAAQALTTLELLRAIGYQFAYPIDEISYIQAVLEIESFFEQNTAEGLLPLIQTGLPSNLDLDNLEQIMAKGKFSLHHLPPEIIRSMLQELGSNYQNV